VTIAKMDWASASFIAHIDAYILEHGFGCEVTLVDGNTESTGESLIESAYPDIAPELWIASHVNRLNEQVDEKKLRFASEVLSDGGEEGFWVPRYMFDEYPSIAGISGIRKHREAFLNEGKAILYGCPEGWNCRTSTRNLFKALDLESIGFELLEPESGDELLLSIETAFEAKTPWLGYYWAPTATLGRYEMVKVDFESGTLKDHYEQCITQVNCADPKPTMFPKSQVFTVTSEAFASRASGVFQYLNKRSYTNPQMNNILAGMTRASAVNSYDAKWFLENYSILWTQWLPRDIAIKVLESL
jgi:glycine betaine/proline transport system substrate-binding protein